MSRPNTATARTIVTIAPAAFGAGFDVFAPNAGLSRELPDLPAARGYAIEIAETNGWAIDDRTGEP